MINYFEPALVIFTVLFIIRRPLFDRINFRIVIPLLSKILLDETYLCDYCLGFFLVLGFADTFSVISFVGSVLKIYGFLIILLKVREFFDSKF